MSLEQKKKKLELMKVVTARHELEIRIEERMDEVTRLQEHVEIQLKKEEDLKKEIEKLN
jgi:hypothetical protein